MRRNILGLLVLISVACSSPKTEDASEEHLSDLANPVYHTVEIKGMKFIPSELAVNEGDIVRFFNKDLVVHDVTDRGAEWTSAGIPSGGHWDLEIIEEVDYFCSLHVVMGGRVVVKN